MEDRQQAKDECEKGEAMDRQSERKRKTLIERQTIADHLRQVIEKTNAIGFTATEAQLLRLKDKITNLTRQAENKNNDLLFNTDVNEKKLNPGFFKSLMK